MDKVMEEAVLKAVQRKFPVCNVIDARTYDALDVSSKCKGAPSLINIKLGKKFFDVTFCTGSFNVYILNIEDMV
jgi:hypothetical protein